jgi:hypothetical protein
VTDEPPTHCPHCDSLLRRDPETPLDAEDGDDRPPLDMAALLNAPQTPPSVAAEADLVEAIETQAVEAKTVDTQSFETQPPEPNAVEIETQAAEVIDTVAVPAVVATPPARTQTRIARTMPSFVRGTAGRDTGLRERWTIIAVVGLALLLALQLLLADRARLAGDARWRPLLHALCTPLRCALPPWREPAAFTLLQRDVRQHPARPGALRVSATFRNDARWPQPWPRLTLTLSDANGRPAGERSFTAEEYLGGAPSQTVLASGESATVAMDILEPASGIVGYDFSFR